MNFLNPNCLARLLAVLIVVAVLDDTPIDVHGAVANIAGQGLVG